MATVINNPAPTERRDVVYSDTGDRAGVGFVVGVIIAIILGILLLAYAIPAIRNASRSGSSGSTNITVPSVNGSSTSGSGSTGSGSGSTGSY